LIFFSLLLHFAPRSITFFAMKFTDPTTGDTFYRKLLHRYDLSGEARELTFSCYKRYALLSRQRTREWFIEALQDARSRFGFHLWAYVIMPEHVHLLVYPGAGPDRMPQFLQALKEPVARKAIAYLRSNAPAWLERLRVVEGKRVRHRFWQPGGGYDRNVTISATLRAMIEYIHANPVRRGLVAAAEEWEWSSARWYAGFRPVKIEMDDSVFDALSFT
jgi:REP-associated tyrosine transposase